MSFFTLLKIWDGTNGPAAVKAASTAAVAADPALVVAISPNNATVPVNSQTWVTTVNGTSASIIVTGYNTAIVTFNGSGTITTGAATFEVSDDGGTTWFSIAGRNIVSFSNGTSFNLTSALVSFQFNVAGYTNFRVRNNTTITGSGGQSIVRVQASIASVSPITVVGNSLASNLNTTTQGNLTHNNAVPAATNIGALVAVASSAAPTYNTGDEVLLSTDLAGNARTIIPGVTAATGAVVPASTLQTGGSDGTDIRTFNTDTQGTQYVRPGVPSLAQWTEAAISFSASGNNTIIAGVGGKTIKVMRMFFVNNGSVSFTSSNLTIQDSSPQSFTGAFALPTAGVFNAQPCGEPVFTGATSAGIVINSSNAVQISGAVWYVQN